MPSDEARLDKVCCYIRHLSTSRPSSWLRQSISVFLQMPFLCNINAYMVPILRRTTTGISIFMDSRITNTVSSFYCQSCSSQLHLPGTDAVSTRLRLPQEQLPWEQPEQPWELSAAAGRMCSLPVLFTVTSYAVPFTVIV